MRPIQLLLLTFVTLLFASAVSFSPIDTPMYQEVSAHSIDTLDSHDDENNPHCGVTHYPYITLSQPLYLIGSAYASPAEWKRTRITLSPLFPQAPPALAS